MSINNHSSLRTLNFISRKKRIFTCKMNTQRFIFSWPRLVQLGVSTSGGCKAAAHAVRRYVRDCRHRRVLLKIGMRNAFNSMRRNSLLSAALVRTPGLYSLRWQAYSSPTQAYSSPVFFGEERVCFRDRHSAGRPYWTRTLCSMGWWSSLSMRRGNHLREWRQSWRCWTHTKHLFCWRMPLVTKLN